MAAVGTDELILERNGTFYKATAAEIASLGNSGTNNIDGGSAATIYTAAQSINGGNA